MSKEQDATPVDFEIDFLPPADTAPNRVRKAVGTVLRGMGAGRLADSVEPSGDTIVYDAEPDLKALADEIIITNPSDELLESIVITEDAQDESDQMPEVEFLDEEPEEECEQIVIDFSSELHDEALQLEVVLSRNVRAAQVFMDNLRSNAHAILKEQNAPDDRPLDKAAWFSFLNLETIAGRWGLSFRFARIRGNHWVLCLNEPEIRDGKRVVLVYDPMTGGERLHVLPHDWDDTQDMSYNLTANEVYQSLPAIAQMNAGEQYDISFSGEVLQAVDAQTIDDKRERMQFDGWNCGPACLFVALLRRGLLARTDPHGDSIEPFDRRRVFADTGVYILLRDELEAGL